MNSNQANRKNKIAIGFAWRSFVFASILCSGAGCQQFPWPGSQQARQFQVDSERMLSEFRAQKKRADELAAKNQQLETRLAETEKSLARQNLQSLSQSNSSSSRIDRRGKAAGKSTAGGSSSSGLFVGPVDDDSGLPDVPPSMSGLLTSGGVFSKSTPPKEDPDSGKDSLQWRPARKK